LNYVIEMFLKQLDVLKCIEELYKEYCIKDHLDKFSKTKILTVFKFYSVI